MDLAFPIYNLPYELQHKILYMVMKHPISYIINDLKNEIDNINNCRYNLDTGIIEPLSFYECLKDFGILLRPRCRCIVCRNPILYLINKIENGGDLTDYEEELAIHLGL